MILLRGEDIVSGRRYKFRELRHLPRLIKTVNNVALGCLYGLKLQKPFYPNWCHHPLITHTRSWLESKYAKYITMYYLIDFMYGFPQWLKQFFYHNYNFSFCRYSHMWSLASVLLFSSRASLAGLAVLPRVLVWFVCSSSQSWFPWLQKSEASSR